MVSAEIAHGSHNDILLGSNNSKSEISTTALITEDLRKLLDILPEHIKQAILQYPHLDKLVEVVMDLGRLPEARFSNATEYLSDNPISTNDLDYSVERVGQFGLDNRAGIERTLHRISALRNRKGNIIGLTCRVGRAIQGTIKLIDDLVEQGKSILMLGRPGVGKTTALREIARVLADDFHKRVVIIDTSNEIAGDGDIPHPAIGRARRMQVSKPELQHQVMIEAVENHMPEVIIIDEIGTELEALAARTIAERGVQLVGTAHGNRLENLIKNPTLSDLIGGIQSVTLGDDEARRRGSQKTVLERKAAPTFEVAIEMLEQNKWVVHSDVSQMVDILLRGGQPSVEIRTFHKNQEVYITNETPEASPVSGTSRFPFLGGWRASGQMKPISSSWNNTKEDVSSATQEFDELLQKEWLQAEATGTIDAGPNGEELPLLIYPYGVSRDSLDQAIRVLNLPINITKDLNSAQAVLAMHSHIKNHPKLRQMAKNRQLQIYTVKTDSISQLGRTLRRMLNIDQSGIPDSIDLNLFTKGGSDDEMQALEEARLAVEQIVLPKKQSVELLPRSSKVRKMQHELVEHYRLRSTSEGEEPNRRLRIYPA